ncbi:ATP-binding protein [Actinomadura sp. 9N407]|uniref:ATP-binding protein n=1 Tax=Actinomadura sp. 9N407 TaxID=3375154 RepID=UPI0037A245AF
MQTSPETAGGAEGFAAADHASDRTPAYLGTAVSAPPAPCAPPTPSAPPASSTPATPCTGTPAAFTSGFVPRGLAWTLPAGPGCASHARRVLAEALAEAGVDRSVIGDAQLMASELATNAHQHARDHGPHELWLYTGPPGETRCAVFDRHVSARLTGYSWTSGDFGRGLSIVQELSEGRWGMLRALSRRTPRVQGKAVWFTIPGQVRLPVHLLGRPAG